MQRREILAGAVMGGLGLTACQATAAESDTDPQRPNTFSGDLYVHTNGGRVSVTNRTMPVLEPHALVHITNDEADTCALRATSYWSGSTVKPYQNNDTYLSEVFNKTESDSENRSWAGSFANAYNDIPEGVTDNGDRTGIIGWAVSVPRDGYKHNGTLRQQTGVRGTAGFQASGSGPNAVVLKATGVLGVVFNDSSDASIEQARAGEFVSEASVGKIEQNIAVYAYAANGLDANFSFFGESGVLYNREQIQAGSTLSQTPSAIAARAAGNSVEFGHPDMNGYGSNLGATAQFGFPFLALAAEADPTGNTFRTRGKRGAVISSDLTGALIFSRLNHPEASGQALTESARIDSDGHLILAETPQLPRKTPASATAIGVTGEVCWDLDFVYVCVAENTWKRAALASW